MLKTLIPSVSLLALVLFSTPARAEFASLLASEWEAGEATDAYLQTPVCRAVTQSSSSTETIELSLVYPKDPKILPTVALRTKLSPGLIAVKINKKETEYLFPLQAGATNADANLYWYAPVNFTRLEQLIQDSNNLDLVLDPKGAATAVKVSLKGSGNALDAAKSCLRKAKSQVPADFFKLLNSKKDDLNPNLGDRTPALMFQKVQEAYVAYQAGQVISADLEKFRKANKPLLDKEKAAIEVLNKATSAFNTAKGKLEAGQQLVSDLTAKLADSKTQLANLQTEKPKAEADLAAKKAIYTPLKAQMLPYEQAITAAQKAVDKTARQIKNDEETIADNTRRIPRLEDERSSLLRQIPGLQSRANSLRSEYDDADRKYRQYDVGRETRNFLDRDFNYTWAKNDLQNGERELSSAQSKLSSAQSALNSCRSTPNANCSSQESAVRSAESEVSAAQSKISSARWKISNAESDAARKAQSESDDLRRKRDSAESEYNSAQAAVDNARNRADEIRRLIPRLRQEIADAEAELPGLRALLPQQQAELAAKIKQHDDFAHSIGFDVAEANFVAATKHLKEVNDGIASLSKAIPKLTKDLAAAQKAIPGLTKTFTRTQTEMTAAQARLAPISEQLKPVHEQESVKLAALQEQSDKFRNAKAVYQELYLELIR